LRCCARQGARSLKLEGDQKVGAEIIRRAIEEPMRHIATNAAPKARSSWPRSRSKKPGRGLQRRDRTYEDLVKAASSIPAKVVRNALQNASSIASLLLTTEALVSEIPEEKKEAPSMPTAAVAWAACTKTVELR
jgi:chaperonin GroEL